MVTTITLFCVSNASARGEHREKEMHEDAACAVNTGVSLDTFVPLRSYNFACNTLPPSSTIVAPFKWLPPRLQRKTTAAATSSGVPNLLLGLKDFSFSTPPLISIKPFAILVGKN